jgi:hypothetical protein
MQRPQAAREGGPILEGKDPGRFSGAFFPHVPESAALFLEKSRCGGRHVFGVLLDLTEPA